MTSVNPGTLLPIQPDAALQEVQLCSGNKDHTVTLEKSSHCFVHVEDGIQAEISIVISGGSHHAIEVFVGSESSLSIVCFYHTGCKNALVVQSSRTEENASVHWQNVTLGSGKISQHLTSYLVGKFAKSDIDWVFYAKEHEQQELSARNVFTESDGSGEITMRGVAEDKAHVQCDGMIAIGEGGGGTNTYLTEDVLMLDKTAKIDAVPGLEIKTNDVRASHSATVSKVTSDDLFYFATRGIAKTEARKMYILGFLGDLTEGIANKNVRKAVVTGISEKYGRKDGEYVR